MNPLPKQWWVLEQIAKEGPARIRAGKALQGPEQSRWKRDQQNPGLLLPCVVTVCSMILCYQGLTPWEQNGNNVCEASLNQSDSKLN